MNQIKCTTCHHDKDETEFTWRNKLKNKRHGQCSACRKLTKDRYYQNNKKRLIKEADTRRRQYLQKYKIWKETLSCSICEETESCCLDFHHINPANKEYEVGTMASYCSWETIMEEAEKCIVVCSNCHRKIHKGIIKI